ncbi:DUF4183 domain-containing protein [Escherichia sp. TWPC-MK]
MDAASFFQDDGTAVTTLPTLATNNSYFNVCEFFCIVNVNTT